MFEADNKMNYYKSEEYKNYLKSLNEKYEERFINKKANYYENIDFINYLKSEKLDQKIQELKEKNGFSRKKEKEEDKNENDYTESEEYKKFIEEYNKFYLNCFREWFYSKNRSLYFDERKVAQEFKKQYQNKRR
jgi:hypothetical protein